MINNLKYNEDADYDLFFWKKIVYTEIESKKQNIKDLEPLLECATTTLDFFIDNNRNLSINITGTKSFILFKEIEKHLYFTFCNFRFLLFNGFYSNSIILLRQFRDDLLLYLLILYDGSDKNKKIVLTETAEDMMKNPIIVLESYLKEVENAKNKIEVRALKNWFCNEETKDCITYSKMLEYLKQSQKIEEIIKSLNFLEKFKEMNNFLNSFAHSKSLQSIELSFLLPMNQNKEAKQLNCQIKIQLINLFEFAILAIDFFKPQLLDDEYNTPEFTEKDAYDYVLDNRIENLIYSFSDDAFINYFNKNTNFSLNQQKVDNK